MITCLHTAQVHVQTFGALLPEAKHVVRADLLDRARVDGVERIAAEVTDLLTELSSDGPVLCSCSTLGPVVDAANNPALVRIDRPAMEAAIAAGPQVVVAICLESTREATLALFDEVSRGRATATLVMCEDAWPYFEAGDMDGFVDAILEAVKGRGGLVLLAQASMAVAAEALEATGVRVFTTPNAAVDAVRDLV